MTSAKEIALSAAQIAREAAKIERLHEEALKENERRDKVARHIANYEAALPILTEWFPGVEWEWWEEGDFGFDTILTDASEDWPPSFKLKVSRHLIDMNEPNAGYRVDIEVGDYRPDGSMAGYSYFSGAKVKSAADIGHYLRGKGS